MSETDSEYNEQDMSNQQSIALFFDFMYYMLQNTGTICVSFSVKSGKEKFFRKK